MKKIEILKNFSYSILSNGFLMLISIISTLIFPKMMSVNDFSYWQLYIFYVGYYILFSFGIADALYLKYGGVKFSDLNFRNIKSQINVLFIVTIILHFISLIIIFLTVKNFDKKICLGMSSFCIFICVIKGTLLYILQATNRIKEYSILVSLERVIYIILSLLLLCLGFTSYKILLMSDIIARLSMLFLSIYYCKEIFCKKAYSINKSLKLFFNSMQIGMKLVIAYIASLLIVGIVRQGIESFWDTTTFGKISLTLSISNFIITFAQAIGIVMYPTIKKINEYKIKKIYIYINCLVMIVLFIIMPIYFPLKNILVMWIPQYKNSLYYLIFMFPMCVFEAKMAILVNTYLKVYNLTHELMIVNVITVIISIIFTFFNVIVLHNLKMTVISITILLGIRCYLGEIVLNKKIFKNSKITKNELYELLIIVFFVILFNFFDYYIGLVIYSILVLFYIYINFNKIKICFNRGIIK